MFIIQILSLTAILKVYLCQDINKLFENINEKTSKFNAIAADIAWQSSTKPSSPELRYKSAKYQRERIVWQVDVCGKLKWLKESHLLNATLSRQAYLMCRGPNYTFDEARIISNMYEELRSIYSASTVCIPYKETTNTANITKVEDAILNYLKTIKDFLNIEQLEQDSMLFAVKTALQEEKYPKKVICLKGEHDFAKVMAFSRNNEVLEWIWLIWREIVGPQMKKPYWMLVDTENRAAKRNSYKDIGETWREELEIPHLRQVCRRLLEDIRPLYTILHGVVRFFLRRKYGSVVPERGPIPAHLLGDLWSQNWEHLTDLIIPNTVDLDDTIKKHNWTVQSMVTRANDFYQSLGLPAMTDNFWKNSVFSQEKGDTRCHGTAADMFKDDDYRLLYCLGISMEDFYVIHHELGHIQYYMAYKKQPPLFRQANSALHETIGDTIMYGVLTPQHMHRLGLINDSLLYKTNEYHSYASVQKGFIDNSYKDPLTETKDGDDDIGYINDDYVTSKEMHVDDNENAANDKESLHFSSDDVFLLKQALNKIPQIPFSLLIDEYRWKYFEGDFTSSNLNKAFWQMTMELQGIASPVYRSEEYFDIAAKFHVPDNTPYIRYFLSSFLQHQLFESLCKAAVFGRRDAKDPLPDTIPLNRCDIYGSKAAGKLLIDFMSRGHSQHWKEILQKTTGQDHLSAAPLVRYYRPLYKLLEKLIRFHRIPIGW